ncbi:MAG: UDP-N-acetylmuramoyl-tripeptide--D-alanyl-D-alanine ligase [Planctomycetota bacterium]|jgi:UDP-N-acetylmuramoyl-tripeptide--D-alanyl-D-alanine ligase
MTTPEPVLTAGFIAAATGGVATVSGVDGLRCRGVSTDTRQPVAETCFVALSGPRHDAHDHLSAARDGGAVLGLISRPEAAPADLPCIVVPEVRRALGRLAAAWRTALGRPVVAITGSVGKTTTKELVRALLETGGPVAAAPSSWNNDIGLPLTLLSATPGHRAIVAEIGTGAPGEILALSQLARPDLSIITAVGRAHLAAFGSVAAIAREKASIVDPMAPGDPVVANRDAPHLPDLLAGRPGVRWYGRHPEADVRLTGHGRDAGGHWFEVDAGEGPVRHRIPLAGDHNALNACGALAAVAALADRGLAFDPSRAGEGLAATRLPGMRMHVRQVGGVEVHDDSWNASPESMVAALRTFDESTRADAAAGERRVVVLGDMLELGPDARRLHAELGAVLAAVDLASPLAAIVLVGEHAAACGDAVGGDRSRIVRVPRLDEAGRAAVLAAIRPGDRVLLKASRGIGLDRVAGWLAERDAETAGTDVPAATNGP